LAHSRTKTEAAEEEEEQEAWPGGRKSLRAHTLIRKPRQSGQPEAEAKGAPEWAWNGTNWTLLI